VLQDSGSKEPTCLESGSNLYQCSRCKITKQVTLSALGHTVDESTYKVVVEPDCETTGRATANCSVCYTEYDITLDALGHDYEDVETECEEGHTLITPTCTRCGQTGTQSKRHDQWIEGHYTTADGRSATCAIEGYTTDTCTDCGTTRRNTIPTTAHNYAIRSVDSTGTLTYRCSKCYTSITKTSTEVFGYWNVRYINQEPNIDNESLYLDVNGDGIINAKDFAMLYNYSKIEALHKATEENSNTETDENSSEDTSTETEEDNQ
jgi:hypothetical protein